MYPSFVSSIGEDLELSESASAISAIHVVSKSQQIKEELKFSLVRITKEGCGAD